MRSWMLRVGALLIAAMQPTMAGVTTSCPTGGVTLSAQSSRLPGILTSVDFSTLTTGSQTGPDLFALALQPAPAFHSLVSLQIEIKAVPSDPTLTCPDPHPMAGVGAGCWVQRQVVDDITLTGVEARVEGLWSGAPRGTRWYTASQLGRLPKRVAGDVPVGSSPFHDLVQRLGAVPAGQVHLRFSVLCEGKELASATLRGDYRPVERPTLLMPGAPVRSGFQDLGTATPSFAWNGSLTGLDFRPSASYRLSVWEVPEGISIEDAVARTSQRTLTTSQALVGWPGGWALLERGKKYVWRVDALKRGLADEWLPSELFGFVYKDATPPTLPVDAQGTAEQSELARLLAALSGVHRAKVEALLRQQLPDPYSLKLEGRTTDLGRLRELLRELQAQKLSVEAVETSR